MSNKKITELTEVTNFSSDNDLIPIVINTDTTPSNASISKANLEASIGGGGGAVDSVNGQTGVVNLDFVDLTTNQNIGGEKTFNNVARFDSDVRANADLIVDNNIELGAGGQITQGLETFTLPAIGGELVVDDNVLTLDNVTPYTPNADYEPATKKYVDDNAGGGGVSTKEFTFGRRIDFDADGRWVGHYNSEDGAQVLNWNRGTGTDASIPNYYGFILLEPNSTLKKLVLSALYDSTYTAIDIQIWGAEVNTTTITKLYDGTFSPISPDTTLQSYDRYELDMGDIVLTTSHRLFVAVRNQQTTLATKTVRGQIKLIWQEA